MSKVPVLPPSGFRDFLPQEASQRLHLMESISSIYRSHGFQNIGISVLENLSTLQGKGGGSDNEKLIFKILKRGEEFKRGLEKFTSTQDVTDISDLGLRFDLTLPLARYCARFKEQLPKPFKVFQTGPVWRADRPQKGRFREFIQCDVDILGSKDIGAELECLAAILEVFHSLQITGVEVHLSDRRLLAALREIKTGHPIFDHFTDDLWAEVLVILDKLDKISLSGVEKELQEKFGAIPPGIAKILSSQGALEDFEQYSPESIASLREMIALLSDMHKDVKILFNPTLVRGQDYYTGTIFELRHPQLAGSLAGGGRYNKLLEIFGGAETPAFGGSIGFERLFLLLQENGKAEALSESPRVFFPLLHGSLRAPLMQIASELRKNGISADIFPDTAKLKNQFKYADDRKIPFTAILGEEEWRAKTIKLKNMTERSEETLSVEDFFRKMREEFKRG